MEALDGVQTHDRQLTSQTCSPLPHAIM